MPPPLRVDLLTASATSLARQIRLRQVSSREVVDAHIAHIETVNPILRAVVRDRFSEARQEADAADSRVQQGNTEDLPPLWGVPCTIKESFALRGMPNSGGLLARKDVIADFDAVAVSRLKGAGAIPLGVTNVSELCMWMESHNPVYGRTGNPYDPGRIAGGSSGGEGAIVGSGASPFGLGADIGGSIRMPAFFGGVFGHKATGGMVPGTGQFPMAENAARRMLATGPLARRAEDLPLLMRVLAGPDGEDDCMHLPLGDLDSVSIEGMRVLVVPENGFRAVHPSLREAQKKAANALEQRGAIVTEVKIPSLARSFQLWSQRMNDAAETPYRTILGNGVSASLWGPLFLSLAGRSPFTLPSILLALGEALPFIVPTDTSRGVEEARALREEISDRIGEGGVLLYPPYTRPAPRHRMPMLTPMDWVYTAIWNALENPVTQVPLGLWKGLPVGVQVVGRHGEDHVTLAVAQVLEEACGGWVPPWQEGR